LSGILKGKNLNKHCCTRELGNMIHPDVHSITVHRTSSDLVTAATGGGLYRSADGGRNWKNIFIARKELGR